MMEELFAVQELQFREFIAKSIPNIGPETIIGVRTPQLRKLAKQVDDCFLLELPHKYFEENQLHALALNGIKDFDRAVQETERFLPYVDNWATCDQLRPKVFAKHKEDLLPFIRNWLSSGHVYTIRFGMEMLMCHYLEDAFKPEYPAFVASVDHEDYYVRMMQAWYFATALAKQFDSILPYITEYRLPGWVHNKTIRKAVESYRISDEQKSLLKQYRIK